MTLDGTLSGLFRGFKQNPWLGQGSVPRRIKQLRRRRRLGVLIVLAAAMLLGHLAWGGA